MNAKIEVIGLGAGDINQLPLGIYRKLITYKGDIHVRTIDHPVIESLKTEDVSFVAYDTVYESNDQFGDVYQQIVHELVQQAKETKNLIYAVPGHPMLAEKTVQLLLDQQDVQVEVIGGQSYLDSLFTSLKIDPIEGFQFIDGTSFERSQLAYKQHMVFCQVYDAFVASEVKLTLLEDLPPEYPVTIVVAAGSEQELIQTVPLVELDQSMKLSNLTSVYVPPVTDEQLNHTFTRLREVIATLRGPNGCPWDQKQTHESLRKYLIEEAYEFIEAVNNEDDEGIVEEMGDVLLQVMLHSQIGEDEGFFTIDDVIKTITEKMIRRHPHVFGNIEVSDADEVVSNWNQIKQKEKGDSPSSLLDAIPADLPQLLFAEELQKKAAKVGFDWDQPEPIWEKITEELNEVKEAIITGDEKELESEFGDVLFAVVNLLRYYDINPEIAVMRTNQKFKTRFHFIENKVKEQGLSFTELTLDELDQYWNQAKQIE
ncbi:nucleoside triphosphate pyrophosphohydrolase [Aquibacillus koreensis]|uniref:Nucleoside triphosphate pyrophosphohydrolase n=1 Tax=Aquibacillus koreensis TaxID=279446 RepID=A0A9X3WNY3_9BACI|nr:nucleoside triphosphate pyrophosphohydrolase [Aquibacillus koreensis]MCT2534308.1 nucleoside triphosphate pyrophosphohydrolase [Aquibacillus koreensis]MDC3422385.1 nucleoside triphosphate pyrophosphohydrolase [Aquibacillus koreensis]